MGRTARARRQEWSSLTRGEEFQAVYRLGKRHATALATIYVLPRDGGVIRLGVPVGRRIGTAVSRNRLRRRFREAFRAATPVADGGVDVVIVPKGSASAASFADLVGAVRRAVETTTVSASESSGEAFSGQKTR